MTDKPTCRLVDEDGNVFSILGRVCQTLRENGHPDQADEVTNRVMSCGSYDEALQIVMDYVEVI